MTNELNTPAPNSQIWVCGVCGKTSPTKAPSRRSDDGWDESCMLNSTLCYVDSLEKRPNGRVTAAKAVTP